MDLQDGIETSESRLRPMSRRSASALGHADRVAPLKAYCTGLLLPGDRKSVEPMAARVEPGRVQAAHQSLHHLVANADWSDNAVLGIVRAQVLPAHRDYWRSAPLPEEWFLMRVAAGRGQADQVLAL